MARGARPSQPVTRSGGGQQGKTADSRQRPLTRGKDPVAGPSRPARPGGVAATSHRLGNGRSASGHHLTDEGSIPSSSTVSLLRRSRHLRCRSPRRFTAAASRHLRCRSPRRPRNRPAKPDRSLRATPAAPHADFRCGIATAPVSLTSQTCTADRPAKPDRPAPRHPSRSPRRFPLLASQHPRCCSPRRPVPQPTAKAGPFTTRHPSRSPRRCPLRHGETSGVAPHADLYRRPTGQSRIGHPAPLQPHPLSLAAGSRILSFEPLHGTLNSGTGPRQIFYTHIMKTGGTSLGRLLRSRFPHSPTYGRTAHLSPRVTIATKAFPHLLRRHGARRERRVPATVHQCPPVQPGSPSRRPPGRLSEMISATRDRGRADDLSPAPARLVSRSSRRRPRGRALRRSKGWRRPPRQLPDPVPGRHPRPQHGEPRDSDEPNPTVVTTHRRQGTGGLRTSA